MGNTIQGTFGWDVSPVIEGMKNAENVVNNGASRMQNKFASIFKRSPNMRAERAISGALQSFAAGDVAGGIQDITSRMTGLGLVAGIAIGAGVAIFEKFREQIVQTRQAHEALQDELTKRPISSVTSLSSEGMEHSLQGRSKLIEDLQAKQSKSFGSELLAGLSVFGTSRTQTVESSEKERIGTQRDLNQANAEQKTIMMAQADLAAKIVSIKKQEADGDEHGAKIAKIMLETQQQQAALRTKGLTAAAFRTADAAVRASAVMDLKDEDKRFKLKNSALAIEEKMASLIHKGLKPEDQKKVRAGLELNSLDEQIKTETNPERLRALKLQRLNTSNELQSYNKQGAAAPGEWGSIERRNAETNDPNVYGSLGYNAANLGQGAAPKQENQNADVVSAIKETNDLIKKALLPEK